MSGPGGSEYTKTPSSSCNSRSSASVGVSPSSTCPPGRSQTSGYHRRPGERWQRRTWQPSTNAPATT